MDEREVAELERELEEQYQQDIAAVRRVRQLLARRAKTIGDDANASTPIYTEQAAQPTAELDDSNSETSRIDIVRDLFRLNPTKPFTVAMLLAELDQRGIVITAVKPASSMHTTIRDLKENREIRVHKKGSGRQPALYIYAGHHGITEERSPGKAPQTSFQAAIEAIQGGLKGGTNNGTSD
jgi:hypothetical protein